MDDYRKKNRERLINTINLINKPDKLSAWSKHIDIGVGSLLAIGFSKKQSHLLLVVSSSGRSILNCETGDKVDRDYDEYAGLNDHSIYCKGIGEVENENILLSGVYGGGLPTHNKAGEAIELVAPDWPEYDLIFCNSGKSPFSDPGACYKLSTDYFRGYGFSWCGNFIAAGTGSDLYVWKRAEKL